MSRILWWRFLGISFLFALVLSAVYLFMLREITSRPGDEVQRSMYLFIARIMEEGSYEEGMRHLQAYRAESPAMPLELWVVDASNTVLARSVDTPPPPALLEREKPLQEHEVSSRGRFFSGSSASAIVRLRGQQAVYLLVRNPGSAARGSLLSMAALFMGTMLAAILLGLFMLTFYLRGRSQEAQKVIQDMAAGNLSARFAAGRLDAIGGLMLHFNSMANEIERLVTQLQANERLRREMLQELGHDLRTPLTSLRAAVDTLAGHGAAMSEAEREEFFTVIHSEIAYFTKLIDDLFFIASMDQPRYRQHVSKLSLLELLRTECAQAEQGQLQTGVQAISFVISNDLDASHSGMDGEMKGEMKGDAFLISRLFRNVFDNAIRHATTRIHIQLHVAAGMLVLVIEDDGQGMTADALLSYGHRRGQRLLNEHGTHQLGQRHISLGLGSVIIKTIVELHGGQIQVSNGEPGTAYPGMRLQLSFPLA